LAIGLGQWSRCCAATGPWLRGAVLRAAMSAQTYRLLANRACGCGKASLFPRPGPIRQRIGGSPLPPGATVLAGCDRDAGTVR
jgi:hypothetical protein